MKIGVLVKTVHFLYAQTGTDIASNFIVENDYIQMVDPLDELAIEYALQLRENQPDATVTVIGYGDDAKHYSCQHGLAMGADRAVALNHRKHDLFNPYDGAQLLESACRTELFDVILCGAGNLDTGNKLEAQFLAERIGMNHLSRVVAIQPQEGGKTLAVERLIEGGNRQLMECDSPVLLTIAKSNITPRYPTLAGFLKAEESFIETVDTDSRRPSSGGETETMQLQSLIRPIPSRQNGTAALARKDAEERVLFMIEGDTSSTQGGGQQVKAGTQEMYQQLGVVLSQAGITDSGKS